MASFPYRLGRLVYRRWRDVVALWTVVPATITFATAKTPPATGEAFSLPGTTSSACAESAAVR